MDNPQFSQNLLYATLNDLKLGVNKLNDKVDTLQNEVVSLREKTPFISDKLNKIEFRLGDVEKISEEVKEKQNIMYGVAGVIAAIVTFLVSTFKSILPFNGP